MNETKKPARILVVDDEERNVRLEAGMLNADGYVVLSAANGKEALVVAAEQKPDVILLDVMMPDMDGFETVARLKADPATHHIPVIMITALDDRDSKMRALEAGAEEFLSKPIDRADLRVRVRNLLRLKEYGDFLAHHNQLLEAQVTARTRQLEEAYVDTVVTLLKASEHKDEETGHHVRRISFYCRTLAVALDLPRDAQDTIYHASPMHDVGKIGIPDHILLKPGGFTPDEWAIMQTHCAMGASILASGTSPYARMGTEIALNHHERWDGGGYPRGLKGEEIPLAARVMQICDVYDALRSRRPYKPPLTHVRAVEIIVEGDGRTEPGHFDPAVLAAFVAQADRFDTIYADHSDD